MRGIRLFSVFFLTLIAVVQCNAASLKEMQGIYTKALAKIEAEHSQLASQTNKNYEKVLSAAHSSAKSSGDLNGVIAARDEQARFLAEKTVPDVSPAGLSDSILEAQNNYRTALEKLQQKRNASIVKLGGIYLARLESMKKALVQQDRIDDALKIDQKMKDLEESTEYSAAKFAQAVESTNLEQSAPAVTKAPAPVAKPSYKTKTFSKIVPAKGNMSGDWSSTNIRLNPGDIVTIEASGQWAFPYFSVACTPNGHTSPLSSKYLMGNEIVPRDISIPYGALVMKRGYSGGVEKVGSSLTFTNDRKGVPMYLDGNIRKDRVLRKGCSGELKVTVTVKTPLI